MESVNDLKIEAIFEDLAGQCCMTGDLLPDEKIVANCIFLAEHARIYVTNYGKIWLIEPMIYGRKVRVNSVDLRRKFDEKILLKVLKSLYVESWMLDAGHLFTFIARLIQNLE